jgi:hypothetical protein
MGGCSSQEVDPAGAQRSKEIDRMLKEVSPMAVWYNRAQG